MKALSLIGLKNPSTSGKMTKIISFFSSNPEKIKSLLLHKWSIAKNIPKISFTKLEPILLLKLLPINNYYLFKLEEEKKARKWLKKCQKNITNCIHFSQNLTSSKTVSHSIWLILQEIPSNLLLRIKAMNSLCNSYGTIESIQDGYFLCLNSAFRRVY